ncbi:uncharacterized protein [Macrobrachium rosenbergii]|uniref:uncharacterized protein isoform X2 n=1 Tax=Macrobrachium rosenbergii TaxID=79674 RepID=UPI0034D45321
MAQRGEKYYKCPVCFKEFFKSHTMKIHLRIHTGEKPFLCNYCPKAFTTSGNLSDHLRVHSTARTFKCKLCGAKFKRNATLKRHHEMHRKYKQEKHLQDNTDSVATGNSEELLHTEIVNQPVYFSRFDRSSEIIVSEQGEETVQTEIVHHPSHVQFDDMPDQRPPTIELFFPTGREDQGNVVWEDIEIEEDLDAFHDATVLELTEEIEDIDGAQVKVYSFASTHSCLSRHSVQQDEEPRETSLSHTVSVPENRVPTILRSDESARSGEVCNTQPEAGYVQSDVAKRYGLHVTKMLKLIQPKEKQVELIKELNQAIHEFLIDNR